MSMLGPRVPGSLLGTRWDHQSPSCSFWVFLGHVFRGVVSPNKTMQSPVGLDLWKVSRRRFSWSKAGLRGSAIDIVDNEVWDLTSPPAFAFLVEIKYALLCLHYLSISQPSTQQSFKTCLGKILFGLCVIHAIAQVSAEWADAREAWVAGGVRSSVQKL